MADRKRAWILGWSILMILLACAGSALAYWQVNSTTVNTLSLTSLKASINEEYEQAVDIMPGDTSKKVVNFVNDGDSDLFLRARVEVTFGTEEDGSFIPLSVLSSDKLSIPYHNRLWEYSGGYFYYKKVLSPGKQTEESLFDEFTLDTDVSQCPYGDKTGKILIYMEAVQAEGNAIELWGRSYEDYGMESPGQESEELTQVTYLGRESKFDIETSRADLFANFKWMVPGCERTQKILVRNKNPEKVKIYLYARNTQQEETMDAEKVDRLLKKYAVITVKDKSKTVYTGNIWGRLDKKTGTLSSPILLGSFSSGQEKELTVTLSLSPLMDNKYQELLGKVEWGFYAQGEDDEITPSPTPETTLTLKASQNTTLAVSPVKTGDTTNPAAWLFLLFVGWAGLFWCRSQRKASKKTSRKELRKASGRKEKGKGR